MILQIKKVGLKSWLTSLRQLHGLPFHHFHYHLLEEQIMGKAKPVVGVGSLHILLWFWFLKPMIAKAASYILLTQM